MFVIVTAGIAVMGHIGLTPQSISVIGGFRAQGRTALSAQAVLEDALALQVLIYIVSKYCHNTLLKEPIPKLLKVVYHSLQSSMPPSSK